MTETTENITSGLEEMFLPIESSLNHTTRAGCVVHEFEFYDSFESPQQVAELVSTLRDAEPNDNILIRINSNGGCVATLASVLEGIDLCQGTVIAYAEGNVYSAAAVMFCACDMYRIGKAASFLFHEGMMGDQGKPSDMQDYLSHHRKRMKIVLDEYCAKFLTRDEIRAVSKGKELFLTSIEMEKRIEKYQDKLEKKREG